MENDDLKNKLKDIEIDKEHIQKVVDNNKFNELIGRYYIRLSNELMKEQRLMDVDRIEKKYDKLSECNSFWEVDKYRLHKVKDFKTTFLCKDKFCNNCKKVKQASRLAKFTPIIKKEIEKAKAKLADQAEENENNTIIYQMTLTVPNPKGEGLIDSIDRMFKAFAQLIRYLKGTKRIKDVDFGSWGYEGCIRSLEITIPNSNEYHPHLHVLIILSGYEPKLKHKNRYSKSYKNKVVRKFSDEEVLLQKVWRLAYDGVEVNKTNIDNLEVGYSCRIDKFYEGDFVELFKYMTKATTEKEKPISYKQFKTLFYALNGRRQIQGYGCFYNLKDDDGISMTEFIEYYDNYLEEMRNIEKPIEVRETPIDLLEDDEYLLISRKKLFAEFKKMKSDKK